ncbi:unnamed protein product, partial [Amoebophrya sp. A25]
LPTSPGDGITRFRCNRLRALSSDYVDAPQLDPDGSDVEAEGFCSPRSQRAAPVVGNAFAVQRLEEEQPKQTSSRSSFQDVSNLEVDHLEVEQLLQDRLRESSASRDILAAHSHETG